MLGLILTDGDTLGLILGDKEGENDVPPLADGLMLGDMLALGDTEELIDGLRLGDKEGDADDAA